MRVRYLLLIVVVPAVLLLALGAIPGLLGGGEVSYVTATEVDLGADQAAHENASAAIPAENLSTNRFPYVTGALEDGVSDPYEEGYFDFQESFAHSPYDEWSELAIRDREAVDGEVAWVSHNGSYYRLEITSELDE